MRSSHPPEAYHQAFAEPLMMSLCEILLHLVVRTQTHGGQSWPTLPFAHASTREAPLSGLELRAGRDSRQRHQPWELLSVPPQALEGKVLRNA